MEEKRVVTVDLGVVCRKPVFCFEFPDHYEHIPEAEPGKALRRILSIMDKGYAVARSTRHSSFKMEEILDASLAPIRDALHAANTATEAACGSPQPERRD